MRHRALQRWTHHPFAVIRKIVAGEKLFPHSRHNFRTGRCMND